MKKVFLVALVFFVAMCAFGNNLWQKTFGGSNDEIAHSVQQTDDGGYILAGYTMPLGGTSDAYFVRLDANGSKLWEKTFGGRGDDVARFVQQTSDGGYIVVGYTKSLGAGGADVYVLKMDPKGNKLWEKTFGGSGDDGAYSVQQVDDGGYIVAGYTSSFGAGESDIYVLRLDVDGNKVWERTFGGRSSEEALFVRKLSDAGFVVAGYTNSLGAGGNDAYVLKLDANGNRVWEKVFGGNVDDAAYCIQQTIDGGYIVVGFTRSFGAGKSDFYVLKLDSDGNKMWEKTFGGNSDDFARCVQQTSDGGYIVAGDTWSLGSGACDVYVLKLDAGGKVLWQKVYGGSRLDYAYSVQQTKEGGYILAGGTSSFGSGGLDVYVIKMDAQGKTGPYAQ
jgi:hypothetical protein